MIRLIKNREVKEERLQDDIDDDLQEVEFICSTNPEWEDYLAEKLTNRQKRYNKRIQDKKYAPKERIKNSAFQKKADKFCQPLYEKGSGRIKKMKGEVKPTFLACNDRCPKNWANVTNGAWRESAKTLFIWEAT